MAHYEQRLEKDLGTIRAKVTAIAGGVDQALRAAVHAALNHDRDLAARVILGDLPINRATREVDRLCHAFVARHLPSAGHLRYISAVLRLMVGLERIGDYAVTVARETVQLSQAPPPTVARDIDLLADHSIRLLTQAMKAFDERNAELARGAKGVASQAKSTFQKVFFDLLEEGEKGTRPVKDLFALLIVLNRIERVSDQAKNICEETIFAATGETKQPKVYRVLFVDAHNDRASLIAEAIARKAFPESGKYLSAGWEPARSIDGQTAEFLEQHGHDPRGIEPSPLPTSPGGLEDDRRPRAGALRSGGRGPVPHGRPPLAGRGRRRPRGALQGPLRAGARPDGDAAG